MAGEDHTVAVTDYVGRLLGESVSADQQVRLRSVQRAAFAAWARKQNLPVHFATITGAAPFSVRQLLSQGQPATASAVTPKVAPPPLPASATIGVCMGIGIDIEDVGALPQAGDFREHPFFRDNFTAAEIAYCLRQSDTRASFCGTWAAKEAILKAGGLSAPDGRLKAIEIGRDTMGGPIAANCQLSISHTATTAVAVCIVTVPMQPVSLDVPPSRPEVPAVVLATSLAPPRRAPYLAVAAASAATVVVLGAITLAMHAWP